MENLLVTIQRKTIARRKRVIFKFMLTLGTGNFIKHVLGGVEKSNVGNRLKHVLAKFLVDPSHPQGVPFKVSTRIEPGNFKQPKNRKDGTDSHDFFTKSIAPTRSRFRTNLRAVLVVDRRLVDDCCRRRHRRCHRRGRWHGGAV